MTFVLVTDDGNQEQRVEFDDRRKAMQQFNRCARVTGPGASYFSTALYRYDDEGICTTEAICEVD